MGLALTTNGTWKELREVEAVVRHCRIDQALKREGRSVKPCLIHGDLWEGNTGTSPGTADIYLFDAGSYYAHNEMKIEDWRCPYNKIKSKICAKTYWKHCGLSEHAEEWDDRNRTYSVHHDIIHSINHMTN